MHLDNISIFIVNLKKDIKKKEYMQKLCQKYNLQVEFIEAVDGRSLNKEDIAEIYSDRMAIETMGRELSRGEIGCALSHKTIYVKMLHNNIKTALILEDDIDFDINFTSLLDLQGIFQENWELVLLGHHTDSSRETDTAASIWFQIQLTEKYTLLRPCENVRGTYGYLITNTGAKKLLENLDMIEEPIDHYTGDSQYINLYIINPAPIKIHEQLSENHNSMKERQILQDTKNESVSLKNLISKLFRKYQIINSLKNNIRRIVLSVKPLRKYK